MDYIIKEKEEITCRAVGLYGIESNVITPIEPIPGAAEFDFGNGEAGAASMALAIMANYVGDEYRSRFEVLMGDKLSAILYHQFKWAFLGGSVKYSKMFWITGDEIARWIQSQGFGDFEIAGYKNGQEAERSIA